MTDLTHAGQISNEQARKTALIVAGVFLLIAAWQYYRGRITAVLVLGSLGLSLVLIGLFMPKVARTFHTYWMGFAVALGWINSRILLGLIFYGVFTPYRLIGRLVKRDTLLRRGPSRDTYWVLRKKTRQTREQFERTF